MAPEKSLPHGGNAEAPETSLPHAGRGTGQSAVEGGDASCSPTDTACPAQDGTAHTPQDTERASMAQIEAVADLILHKVVEILMGDRVDSQTVQRLASAVKCVRDIKGLRTDPDAREQEVKIRSMELKLRTDAALEEDKTIIVHLGDAAKYAV